MKQNKNLALMLANLSAIVLVFGLLTMTVKMFVIVEGFSSLFFGVALLSGLYSVVFAMPNSPPEK